MKNSTLCQYVVMGVFIFFTVIGAVLFATYRSQEKAGTRINITMWGVLPSDSFVPFYNAFFSNNQLKYIVNYVEKDSNTFDRDLVEALASGTGPDAIILPSDLIVRYSNKIFTIPFSVLPELTYKQTFVQEGELYLNSTGTLALPFSVDPLVMYWNRDIFNNVGVTKPPASWSDISGLVSKMTTKDLAKNISRSTVALGEFRNINNAKEILSALIFQAGSSIVGLDAEDGTLSSTLQGNSSDTQDTPASLALEFFTNFSNPVKPEYSWNRSLANSLDVFANGDLAIYFGFASEFTNIKEKNPNLNFGVALLPQPAGDKIYNTFGNMLGLAIIKNSKDPAGAYTVLNTLASAEAVPYWKDILNVPSARRDVLGQIDANAIKTVFNQSAVMSKGWFDPNKVETSAIFQEMIESYTTGRVSLEQAVSTASDQIDSLLLKK